MKKMNSVKRFLVTLLTLCLALGMFASEAFAEEADDGWVNFLLICNEGMNNSQGNAGNTLMVVAMHPETGKIRLCMFTWDTFIDYEGYDVPQKLDMPYRNNGPEEAMKVFNDNFGTNITLYMSLNYLNLASMIDSYGGVVVDVSRAERNALNGMVGSKKEQLQAMAARGTLSQSTLDLLADEYYLNEFGPETHLNGLQAVGFGWLQYDSVYNCCQREIEVVSNMFHAVSTSIASTLVFYTDESGYPDQVEGRRAINLDSMTDEDYIFMLRQMSPIFQMSYNNLSDDDIYNISMTLARVAYNASKQGVNIFDTVSCKVLPLEATDPYDTVAGVQGHLIDKEANTEDMLNFLYGED